MCLEFDIGGVAYPFFMGEEMLDHDRVRTPQKSYA